MSSLLADVNSTIQGWLTAVGTLGAVLVALYLGPVRDRLRRPHLYARHDDVHADRIVVAAEDDESVDTAWVRIRVGNRGGRLAAEDVEVVVTWVDQFSPDVVFGPVGLSLPWSHGIPQTTSRTLPPGVEWHVDVARIRRSSPEGQLGLELMTVPNTRELGRGTFEVRIAVTARNADASHYRFGLTFDGVWGDDVLLRDHLFVRGPEEAAG
jgi:hypothetical protein